MAVVPELRPRGDQDGSRARSGCRSPSTATTRRRLLAAVTPRTKLVYLCNPNNPTGTMIDRAAIDAYFERVPGARPDRSRRGVLRVRRRARLSRRDRGVLEARGATGARPPDVLEDLRARRASGRVRGRPRGRRPGDRQGSERVRRQSGGSGRRARESRRTMPRWPGGARSPPKAGPSSSWRARTCASRSPQPAVANFLFLDLGRDTRELFDALLREGVIVRPLAPFGAATAIRVTVGTPDENEVFAAALARVLTASSQTVA